MSRYVFSTPKLSIAMGVDRPLRHVFISCLCKDEDAAPPFDACTFAPNFDSVGKVIELLRDFANPKPTQELLDEIESEMQDDVLCLGQDIGDHLGSKMGWFCPPGEGEHVRSYQPGEGKGWK